MKTTLRCLVILLLTVVLAGLTCGTVPNAFADIEIDLGDDEEAAPTPIPSKKGESSKAVDVEEDEDDGDDEEAYSEEKEVKVEEEEEAAALAPTPVPTAVQVTGVMKMKDYYDAGIKSYKAKEYQQAIRYLEKAVTTEDAYTKDYYYAEANAMLGVIYQFYFTVPGSRAKAHAYYKEALRIDPQTRTARKYVNQVRP